MAESSNRQKDIFLKALDLSSPADRDAFVTQACGSDESLRRQVEALLEAHAASDSFLEKPAAATAPTIDQPPIAERPGMAIGPYKLLQQIGEGGMGVVFMAEQQEPVRRKVALKIIKPGMDSAQVIARFEAERQALAMMDHQNIARVLDAGTTASGRPYFVMELVHGVPITTFCDDNHLTPRERLELFIPICHAIQHAHQKGIIHRDIKPSNVLVTMYDDKPVPKVIDFGVAKAVEQRLTEKTLFTQFGALVGTFEYMSPEQAEMNAFGVDTRSDIYSLGVLLYELLTGTTPLEKARVREAALNEVVRLIKEEEPPRPSVRLSSSGTLAKIAAARKTEPDQLAKLVRGELDWIVMKSLEKDRSRRYETANGLAQDVQRYLIDEPVQAGPPSASYRLRKFVKRNRGPVLAASIVLTTLLLGIVGTSWGWFDAVQARKDEADQRKIAVKAIGDARDNALAKANAEEKSRKLAEDQVKTKARQARSLAAHLAFERGNNRLDRGDVGPGLLWLVRGLEEAPDDEVELRQSIRRILGGWRNTMVVPRPALLAGKEQVHAVAFSRDGQAFFTSGSFRAVPGHILPQGFVRRWDAKTLPTLGDSMATYHDGYNLALSMDGKRLATAGYSDVTLFNLEGAKPVIVPLQGNFAGAVNTNWWVSTLAFSPDGQTLLVGYRARKPAGLLDAKTGEVRHTLEIPEKEKIDGAHNLMVGAFSADGKTAITVHEGGSVFRWDVATGKPVGKPTTLVDSPNPWEMKITPDGNKLVVFNWKENATSLSWYALNKANRRHVLPAPKGGVFLSVSADGNLLATREQDTLTFWDIRAEAPRILGQFHASKGGRMAFSPDGKTLLASGSFLWEVPTGPGRQIGAGSVGSVAFCPDGKFLMALITYWGAVASPSAVQRYEVATGKPVGNPLDFPGLWFTGGPLAFSSDGKVLATGARLVRKADEKTIENQRAYPNSIQLWDGETGQPLGEPLPGAVQAVAFSADNKTLVTVGAIEQGQLGPFRSWDVATRKPLQENLRHDLPRSAHMHLSPRGTYYATFERELAYGLPTTLELWQTNSGKSLAKIVHRRPFLEAVFSADEKTLLTVDMRSGFYGENPEVRIWDVATGKARFNRVPIKTVDPARVVANYRAALMDDGQAFATATQEEVQFRDMASGRPLGPPLSIGGTIVSVTSQPGANHLAVATHERGVILLPAPSPVKADVDAIRLWIELATYRELDTGGSVVELDAKTWRERYDRLQKLGGPP